MKLVRSALLWASQSPRMERIVRRSRPVRPIVSRFMPGETIDEAMLATRSLKAEGTPVILTYLGENVSSDADADATLAEYDRLFSAIGSNQADAHVSIKLTQLGWDIDRSRTLERVRVLSRTAKSRGTTLAIDMEGSPYVDSTVEAYTRLKGEFDDVAICLQAYLHRTPDDLKRLLPLKPYIRLVKGAYREPARVALQSRGEIDARYQSLAGELLQATKQGARVVFGTHDLPLVSRVRDEARSAGVPETAYEIQMLYGIQDAGRRRIASEGTRTRVLISYGKAWYPWFMRRLAEKPSNVLLVARNLFS